MPGIEKTSFGKKNRLPILALSFVLGALVFFLIFLLGYIQFFFAVIGIFGAVTSPIAGFILGIAGLPPSIGSYRRTKDRAYIAGIVMSSIAIALPVLAVLIPVLLLSTGAIRISLM